ncbi:hypothetical protein KFK09_011670 [Dendrobium nobile]|uniref:Reverse transcriptase zinc-binding domain-containing protein n=1 Tax=Dendrobium nobile TaxID=94219 RepID=A0A8T3BDA9_DENNO|nr:hypothetical protein KFK09_011670 [Dendrobium nobile]
MTWDPWLNGLSLPSISSHLPSRFISVKEYIFDGKWQLKEDFSSHVTHAISSVPISNCSSNISWMGEGVPSFKTFKLLFFSEFTKISWHKFIWHKRTALRFSTYDWLAMIGGLESVEVLVKRNIIISPYYPLCSIEDESINHLFFQCDFSFQILRLLIPEV